MLQEDRTASLRTHADGCARCAAALREAAAERDAFLARHPPAARVETLLAARRPRRRAAIWAAFAGGAVRAAVLAALFVWPSPEGVRLKGQAARCRLVRAGEVVAVLEPGAAPLPARAGDTLRCVLAPRGREHVEVWGQDGDEPPRKLGQALVSGPTELPDAFAVEDRGEMRLILVGSAEAPDAAAVLEAIRAGGADGLRVETFTVAVP